MVRLSIVTCMYRSEPYVRPFYEAMTRVANTVTKDYEIIFVDDGSPDSSYAAVRELAASDPKVRTIKLSRNLGQSIAMLAGLQKAQGELIYTSDIDLEDPPELLERFYHIMRKNPTVQSVYGYMANRQGKFLERWLGWAFYKFLNFLQGDPIPSQVWARMMTRQFLDSVLSYSEYHIFWSGLFYAVGFKQVAEPVERRRTGRTSYNYAKKIDLALSAVTSFSTGPLQLIFAGGLVVSIGSMVAAIFLVAMHFSGNLVPGWASIVLSILFMGGITNLSIGVIGFYVGRIFIQSKSRPHFFVEEDR